MMPDIDDEYDGWWIYWMVPEAFLKYKEYTSEGAVNVPNREESAPSGVVN